ncbi:MAG: DUF1643 domain-containing protein [Phycisphaeraceae bacterium]|nr:MAG: DUF1643 domain-containing protein [Phycisphaeraceae bacterium]
MLRTGAEFDPTGKYRFRLWRRWRRAGPAAVFIMLNPSTADAQRNDPTVRRCIGFAHDWGYAGVEVVNIFALRSTLPAALLAIRDPVGPGNDRRILAAARRAHRAGAPVVAAWGNHGALHGRGGAVLGYLDGAGIAPVTFGLTGAGHPRHPLYTPAAATLTPVPIPLQSA